MRNHIPNFLLFSTTDSYYKHVSIWTFGMKNKMENRAGLKGNIFEKHNITDALQCMHISHLPRLSALTWGSFCISWPQYLNKEWKTTLILLFSTEQLFKTLHMDVFHFSLPYIIDFLTFSSFVTCSKALRHSLGSQTKNVVTLLQNISENI